MEALEILSKNQSEDINSETNKSEDIDQMINRFFNTLKDKNSAIKEPKDWDNLDIFDINELERIKNTPEYIIEKIKIHIKDFLTLKDYFYNLKKSQNINVNDNGAIFQRPIKKGKKETETIKSKNKNPNKDKNKDTEKEENSIQEETTESNNSSESSQNSSSNLSKYQFTSSGENVNQSNFSINLIMNQITQRIKKTKKIKK